MRFRIRLATAKLIWFTVVPWLFATLATWAFAVAPADSDNAVDRWLHDQVALVWLGSFALTGALLRYWKAKLPPSRIWQIEQARQRPEASWSFLLTGVVVLIAASSAYLLRAFVGEPCKVRTSSMVPTLLPGEQVLVSKLARGPAKTEPKRGSMILFSTPDPALAEVEAQLVKRVIALPGDELTVEHGHAIINGWKVPYCDIGRISLQLANIDAPLGGFLSLEWLGDSTYLILSEGLAEEAPQGPYHVPPGEVWVLGDNRNNSSDSRYWFNGKGGGVPSANVIGSPQVSYFSPADAPAIRLKSVELPSLPASAGQLQSAFERCLAEKPAIREPPAPRH